MITEAQKQKMLECLDPGNFCKGIKCDDCPLQIRNYDCDIDEIYDKVEAIQTTPPKLSKHERKELVEKEFYRKSGEIHCEYNAEMKKIDEETEE